MDSQKISKIASLIELAENNLKTARILLRQLVRNDTAGAKPEDRSPVPVLVNDLEQGALEVVEGVFDGQNMIGNNGQIYNIPPNYASKTKLVEGDCMKRILTSDYKEMYKMIQKTPSRRVLGSLAVNTTGDYVVHIDDISQPVKVLKASITFAMKQQGLNLGDMIAVIIPAGGTATWGAFDTVVQHSDKIDEISPGDDDEESEEKNLPNLEQLKKDHLRLDNDFSLDSFDEFKL